MSALLLALDLGTTSTRALLLEADGSVCGRASRPIETRFPAPGRVEGDPEQWLDASVEAMRAALRDARCEARDVAALGLVTQRATVVAWDAASGRALGPAIGWQDQRTAPRVAELVANGIPITTLPSATKLEWWIQNDPAVRAALRAGRLRFGTPDAWLTHHLSGGLASATDPGQASCTGLYDLGSGDWSAPALAFFGIEAAWLPDVVASDAVVAETPAGLLGAPIPLAARAGDQQAACFAHGARSAGDAKLTLGTAAMCDVHTGAAPSPGGRGAYPLALWRLSDAGDAFCLEGTVVTAGACVEWLVELGLLPRSDALDSVAGSVATAEGVAFVPALQGLGTPHLDDSARGLLVGLTRGTTAAHVVHAVVEGIAQRCVDVCEALDMDARPLHVDGGLSRSDVLLQRLADLGGRPVLCALEAEATAVGAAWLAAVGAGWFLGHDEGHTLRPEGRRFEPRMSAPDRDASRDRWRAAVARCAGTAESMR